MANQVGPDTVSGAVPQPGQFAGPGQVSADVEAAAPGAVPAIAVSDSSHIHEPYHGRPVSWVAVTLIIVGFLLGGLSLVFVTWPGFWVGAGLAVIGALLAAATDIFEDWY
jgi:hypothetical protein